MQIEYGRINEEFIKEIKQNRAVLNIFKNHTNPSQIRDLLVLKDDRVIIAYKFQLEVLKVEPKYNKETIEQEYGTALRIARMGSQWAKFQKNKRWYPNLRFLPGGDIIPNEKLKMLYGIVRPVDDPFWNTYYPPNYLGCNCRVEPTDGDATDLPIDIPLPDEGFRFNAGKPETF